MSGRVLLIFLLCGICVLHCSDGETRQYHFVNVGMSWADARQYCREHYTDLATVTSTEDINRLPRPKAYKGYVWIGLFDHPTSWDSVTDAEANSWKWSATNSTSTSLFQSWSESEPDYCHHSQQCVTLGSGGLWINHYCNSNYSFVCFSGSSTKEFHVLNQSGTWYEAAAYCRQHYRDLAVIDSADENKQVASAVVGSRVWIGLYRKPWRWSDNSTVHFRNWRNLTGGFSRYHCAVENADHFWEHAQCDQTFPFFCQVMNAAKKKITVRIQLRSDLNMSDPATYRLVLQKISEKFNKTGLTDVNVTWKTPPKKQNQKKEDKSEL